MGADSVRLFDKGVSDHILGLSKPDLIRYLEERLDTLRRKETAGAWIHSLVLSELNQRGGSVAEAVEQLLAEKNPLAQLKEELVYDLAFGEEVILLDYWGCYVHVFSEGDPKGSLSSMKYLKDEEEAFLLLKPIHVDRMIRSLKEHINDLQVMDKTAIQRLEYMRDFCAGHPISDDRFSRGLSWMKISRLPSLLMGSENRLYKGRQFESLTFKLHDRLRDL